MKRRASSFNTQRIDNIYTDPHEDGVDFHAYGDMTDSSTLCDLFRPLSVIATGRATPWQVSFETAEYTANADAGTLRFLEAIRTNLTEKTRFYQASTSELGGKVQEVPQVRPAILSAFTLCCCKLARICVNY